ncbi:hypothetical protein B0A48_15920 [Cryoendolithus antarcticus]|uniref:Cercosporin MFS transporter CTB4 n=1 Tax=Cryoendolithus antarcticus TaxID=1507870 RepID=A0A1V8SG02_9PEZI|nr:hypothetical protein B0A48_15920 [Cryoendolithus antarcticus]
MLFTRAFVLAGLALSSSAAPVEERQTQCLAYTLINTRGTGESQGESSGFRTVNSQVHSQVSSGSVIRLNPIHHLMAPAAYSTSQYNTVYPASFSQNSASGTRDIVNHVTTILRSNPNACIILEGYSQGAAATVDAMSELTGASYDAVKGVLLFGNPKHKSGLACNVDQNGGTTTLNVNGISASRYSAGIPANWVAKTLDVCNYLVLGRRFKMASSARASYDTDKINDDKDVESLPDLGNSERSHQTPRDSFALDVEPRPDQNDHDKESTFKVTWDEHDPLNPKNFSLRHKIWITTQLGLLAIAASMGSSIIAPAEPAIAAEFHVSTEVTVLVVSLYVLGFALGPLLWAPLSELFGRKVSMLPAMFIFSLFSIGTATSKSAAAVFITRFFSGVFGSAPVSNVSAALGDLYEARARGIAVSFYALAVIGGPTIGPVIGAALTETLSWRWTQYIQAIFGFSVTVLSLIFMPELYGPVLLSRKAKTLRKSTGENRYYHPHESQLFSVRSIITKHLELPLKMLFTEPMVAAIALYASFVYGLLYLTLEVFPIVFAQDRGWGLVVSTLPFLGLFVGVCFALTINLANQPRYARAVDANGGKAVPEARLPPMIIGGVLFVIGLFWFGWTAVPVSIPWIVPVIATAFIGAGFNVIFQQCINFLVDTYALHAASAVSANTFLRSLMGSGLPLAAKPMFNALGVGPAMSILGAVAVLALPAPVLFMKYGKRLRAKSRFTEEGD